MKKKILFVFGTRPEVIKLAFLIKKISPDESYECRMCSTGQHEILLQQALELFEIKPQFNLNIMRSGQSQSEISIRIIEGLAKIINDEFTPDYIIVQGDTASAFSGALCGFYSKVKVIHIEAGLRSFDTDAPYPEEMYRRLISQIATYHFAPTQKCVDNLILENIGQETVWKVGNTVVDALIFALQEARKNEDHYKNLFNFLDRKKKLVLITSHRRENFGQPLREICDAIKQLAEQNEDFEFAFLQHLNPNSKIPVENLLGHHPGIHLIEPLKYYAFIWLLNYSELIITDSGGVQEEAATLGKPILVIRNKTERTEGIEIGNAHIVGTSSKMIVDKCQQILMELEPCKQISVPKDIYGDGLASEKIVSIFRHIL